MPTATTEDSKEFAQLVRIHEANSHIGFPTLDEQNFRIAIMKKLGERLGLKELRGKTIEGPGTGVQRPPSNRK